MVTIFITARLGSHHTASQEVVILAEDSITIWTPQVAMVHPDQEVVLAKNPLLIGTQRVAVVPHNRGVVLAEDSITI